jgi:glycosyltransferase involved in cell wall biosynthesis
LAPRDEFTHFLIQEGFQWRHLPLQPRGKNIFREFITILFLIIFYRREKPDLVHHFTPKGVIYGSLAAKIAGARSIFNTITGLGSVFSDSSNMKLQNLVMFLYQIALANTTIIFQNPDDQNYFYERGIVNPENCFLIKSSGVDMKKFKFSPQLEGNPVVLLSSRFVEEKGIRYFVDASRILKSQNIKVRFVLVGKPEENQPTTIRHAEITQWINNGLIEWWGWHQNMEQIYPLANIVCLPTYYKEGVPKALIEAAACGRPLVATDVPGCREIIRQGVNGLLVPPKNAIALADAIAKLSGDKKLCDRMGRSSREIAVSLFSLKMVIDTYFEIYHI